MLRIVLPVLVLAFTIYCLVDVAKTDRERVRALSRGVWLLVVLVPLLGGLLWLATGRPRGSAGRTPPRGPLGPDDDPDFLRGL